MSQPQQINPQINFFKKIFIFPIQLYQRFIRPALPSSCVFHAHGQLGCSDYTVSVIKQHGVIKGVLLGTWRILRCHPWQKNFNDPIL